MKAKIMDASHLLIILSEQEALRLGLNSISVDIPTTLSKITLAKVFLEGCKYTGFSYSEAENITIRALSIRDGTFVLLFSVHIPNMSRIKSSFQRKKFRIKETTGPYVYQFQNCTDMMDAAERLCMAGITCPKAKLLRFGDKYRIIFHLRWKTSKLARIWHFKRKRTRCRCCCNGTRNFAYRRFIQHCLQHLPLYKTLNIFSCLF